MEVKLPYDAVCPSVSWLVGWSVGQRVIRGNVSYQCSYRSTCFKMLDLCADTLLCGLFLRNKHLTFYDWFKNTFTLHMYKMFFRKPLRPKIENDSNGHLIFCKKSPTILRRLKKSLILRIEPIKQRTLLIEFINQLIKCSHKKKTFIPITRIC